jgi:hypothetical protein
MAKEGAIELEGTIAEPFTVIRHLKLNLADLNRERHLWSSEAKDLPRAGKTDNT